MDECGTAKREKYRRKKKRGTSMNLYFLFFKQRTAYDVESRDWSSDVCSSDLKKKKKKIFNLVRKKTESGSLSL